MSINFKFPVDEAVANHKSEMESTIKTARQHFKDMKAKTQPAYIYKTLVCRPVGEAKPAAVTQEIQS